MAALLFKVGALALRTLAKPLGGRFQSWVMSHEGARRHVISMAQAVHRLEVLITRGAEGRTGKAFVGAMTEEKSVELASKIASEGFVFTVGALVIAWEYDRQARKDAARKKAELSERSAIMEQARMERQRLQDQNDHQEAIIQQLSARMQHLEQVLQQLEVERAAKQQQQPPAARKWGFFYTQP